MEHLLPPAELLVQCDGGIVPVVRLDVDHPGAPLARDLADAADQCGGNAPAAEPLPHGKVVDIDLPPGLLELGKLIGDKAARFLSIHPGEKRDVLRLRQPFPAPALIRRTAEIAFPILEDFREQAIEGAELRRVARAQPLDPRQAASPSTAAVPLALTISIEPLVPSTS